MAYKSLTVKQWLLHNRVQFEFVTETLVKRLSDNKFFVVGPTNYTTVDGSWSISAFYTDRMHVDVYLTHLGKESKKHKWYIRNLF
jgi:hypothetical protein